MGSWGTAIFSDDFTADVKKEYQMLLAFGVPQDEALRKTIEYFEADENDEDEADNCRFWFAISSVQLKYNRLEKDVADITLKLLHDGGDLDDWEPDERKKRKAVLDKLEREILNYDMSALPKKVSKPKIYKAEWKLGDVLSYRLINYRNALFYNMYVGLQIVNIQRTPISHIIPDLVYDEWMDMAMFNYIDTKKPTMEELLKCGYRPIIEAVSKYKELNEAFYTITFSYNPYKGDLSKYDYVKTTGKLYDIEVLGNQKDLNYPVEKLENCAGMYDNIEELMSGLPEYKNYSNP